MKWISAAGLFVTLSILPAMPRDATPLQAMSRDVLPLQAMQQEELPLPDSVIRERVIRRADSLFNGGWWAGATGFLKLDSTRIRSVEISEREESINIHTDRQLVYAPVRESLIDSFASLIRQVLPLSHREYSIRLYSGGKNLRYYIPNYHRSDDRDRDRERSPWKWRRRSEPLAVNLSKEQPEDPLLSNINIALWHSHGWYYEPSLHRWEWQRARIFQTVEDLYPMAYTLPFLVPMLENAGATVLLPRERDWQKNGVVVDNNGSSGGSLYIGAEAAAESADSSGFAMGQPPYVDENPFRLGTYSVMECERDPTAAVQWIPEIPETGDYAVYVSYHASDDRATDARYRVHHSGGITEFAVNQQMGGGTWVYLGKFRFPAGIHPGQAKVVLTNQSRRRRNTVSADAVRFGGGMGQISRNGLTSNRPAYQEAARYYLQYAGFPDTLVWKLNDNNDYNDDYQSRGEWVNYLMGAPSGPSADRNARGLGIPVDLSLGFHTDAGITSGDTVIGTLGIYSTTFGGGYFPGGLSRMASRDLTDLVQTSIVEDLRAAYDPAWTRRAMWDRGYSEAYRPNVPAMLLELFSHQNFIDMRFGQEPQFRFDVSRAIYKGILSFLHAQYGIEEVVQPLPVDHFSAEVSGDTAILLRWKPRADPLEPTATASSYRIYTRINEQGAGNGRLVNDTFYILEDPVPDSIYSFRVTALNRGGESFSSEELSACIRSGSGGTLLVVCGFDRTGGPAWFNDTRYAGFMDIVDQGVPDGVDLHTVGSQYDFLKSSPWLDDDSPGHGASYADLESEVIPGNSFDFSFMHGRSIRNAGYSFSSVSDESVTAGIVSLDPYPVVDYLTGEERTVYLPKNDTVPRFRVWPPELLDRLQQYLSEGGRLLVSGAHIASDMHENNQDTVIGRSLKFQWRTGNASRTGRFYFMDPRFAPVQETFSFNTGIDPEQYTVEGADALEPFDTTAVTLIRYRENNMSAGVATGGGEGGVVALGFPFESIRGEKDRDLIMKKLIRYLMKTEEYE